MGRTRWHIRSCLLFDDVGVAVGEASWVSDRGTVATTYSGPHDDTPYFTTTCYEVVRPTGVSLVSIHAHPHLIDPVTPGRKVDPDERWVVASTRRLS